MAKNNRMYEDARKGGDMGPGAGDDAPAASIHDADHLSDGQDDERLDDASRSTAGRSEQARDVQETRGGQSREAGTRITTDAQRISAFKQSVFNSALPDLPEMEGFHLCWLTTTNPRDPIAARERMGYELLTKDMVPGFGHSVLKAGDYAGLIGVNEMIAARIPLHLYQAYMEEAHHNAPLEEEKRLKANTQAVIDEASKAAGKAPEMGDGTAELGKGPSRGKFED